MGSMSGNVFPSETEDIKQSFSGRHICYLEVLGSILYTMIRGVILKASPSVQRV